MHKVNLYDMYLLKLIRSTGTDGAVIGEGGEEREIFFKKIRICPGKERNEDVGGYSANEP